MQAERMRAEVVAANMANAETTRTASAVLITGSRWFLRRVGRSGFLDSLASASGAGDWEWIFRRVSGDLCRGVGVRGGGAGCGLRGRRRLFTSAESVTTGPSRRGTDGYVSYPELITHRDGDLMGATRAMVSMVLPYRLKSP